MLLIGIVVGLVLGLLLGGHFEALVNVRLRFAALLLVALVIRYGTQFGIANGAPLVESLRLPLYLVGFGCLAVALWLNRDKPGLLAVMVGVAANGLAIAINGGFMPVFLPALGAAGLGLGDLSNHFHVALPADLGLPFLLQGGPIGDIIPFPVPFLNNVGSIGDVFISTGLGWFVFTTLLHGDPAPQRAGVTIWSGERAPRTSDRPIMLGGGAGPGLAPPSAQAGSAVAAIPAIAVPGWTARIRSHPYLRLARDARFSAFWMGQTISLFGDRLNQIALGFMVLTITGSAMETGLVFLAATLPNLMLGPIAGPFVDRWNQKAVMIVSDLLRAGLVMLIPFVGPSNLFLVYPIVFLVTTVSLFFRPAKAAVVPRMVDPDDLVAANAAIWTGETVADIAGYPLAGLLVGFLASQVWVAFWLDAASYVISAILILSIMIAPAARAAAEVTTAARGAVGAFLDELRDGWHVLRRQPTLFQNTLISAVAQLSVGTTLALTIVYGRDVLDGRFIPFPQNYAAIDAAIGIGNLIGGFAVGAVGSRLRKGWLVVVGFIVMGASTVALGLTSNVLLALVAALVMGVFNLVYIIPTQALFAELTPEGFMGRVVAFRSSLVFGAMTLSMAVSSIASERVPVGIVIAVSGAVTLAAGLAAAFLPAVRDP